MDIRGQRTQQLIENTFLELLRDMCAARITVTQLCRRAGINRSTFYKHYLDVPDLHSRMEDQVLQDFEEFLKSTAVPGTDKYRSVLLQMLHYMQQNGGRFYLLCSANAGSELPARTFQLINEYAFPLMREKMPGVEEQKAALLYRFLTRGCGALLVDWLRDGGSMDVQELADFILRLSGAAVDTVAEGGR